VFDSETPVTLVTRKNFRHKWGDRVRLARLTLRMSQATLADEAGASQQLISMVERGLSVPSDAVKVHLARALHQRPEYLFPLSEVAADIDAQVTS
jgi:transcriptional regulator with XRE-family HTH domain